jgi:hypothetical protein
MRLSTYLSARIGIDKWTFSSADIANQTGLNRNTVYGLCNQLDGAGIFRMKEEKRGCPTIYDFDKSALLNYLQGDTAIEDLGKATCQSNTHLPANSTSGLTCQSDTHEHAIPTSTSCQLDTHLPASPTSTIIKREKEDENTYIQTEGAYVCISQTPDAESKADSFIKQAKSLQSNSPELGIIIKTNARSKLVDLFNAQTNLTVTDLGAEWFDILNHASSSKACVSIDDPLNYAGTKVERGEYDDRFWIKRSTDLTFFINNRSNVLTYLN